jgi:hypothetical protein
LAALETIGNRENPREYGLAAAVTVSQRAFRCTRAIPKFWDNFRVNKLMGESHARMGR